METFSACDETFDHGGSSPSIPKAPPARSRACSGSRRARRGSRSATRRMLRGASRRAGRAQFRARRRFRGRVLVSFGEPVDVSSFLAVYRGNRRRRCIRSRRRFSGQWSARSSTSSASTPRRSRARGDSLSRELERELWEEPGLRDGGSSCCRSRDRWRTRSSTSANRTRAHRAALAADTRLPRRTCRLRLRDEAGRTRLAPTAERHRLHGHADHRGSPALRVRRGRELPPSLPPGWLAGRTSRRQTDYATTRLLASVVAFRSSGRSDVARRMGRRCRLGGGLLPLASARGSDRVSVSGRTGACATS